MEETMPNRKAREIGRTSLAVLVTLTLLLLAPAHEVFGHGKELEKKGGAAAAQEAGPHGGAVVDIGDGHFELVREPSGVLSLYRLDDALKLIPAEDVDRAQLHAVTADGRLSNLEMQKAGSGSVPLHFSVDPKIKGPGNYLAVVSVSMSNESQNLRFQVKSV
jgi:hypothetical protein